VRSIDTRPFSHTDASIARDEGHAETVRAATAAPA